jgi:hypothetical protein
MRLLLIMQSTSFCVNFPDHFRWLGNLELRRLGEVTLFSDSSKIGVDSISLARNGRSHSEYGRTKLTRAAKPLHPMADDDDLAAAGEKCLASKSFIFCAVFVPRAPGRKFFASIMCMRRQMKRGCFSKYSAINYQAINNF